MKGLAEKQLTNFNDKELIVLYQYTQSEDIRERLLPCMAFTWSGKNCKELSDISSIMRAKEKIPFPVQSDEYKQEFLQREQKITNAQLDRVFKCKDSGLCTKCKKPTQNIIKAKKEYAKKEEAYPIDILFTNIWENTGLCLDCITEFLHENLKEHAAKIDDDTVNKYRQKVSHAIRPPDTQPTYDIISTKVEGK